MKKGIKNIVIGAAAAAAVVGAVSAASNALTKYMVKMAMNREQPRGTDKNRVRISGDKKLAEIMEQARGAAERLEQRELERVEIDAPDGVKLVGHLRECPDAKRFIVAVHGWRSSWSLDFGMSADFWYDSGCTVLYVEQRGQGGSGGDYIGFGLLERYDCLEWAKWAEARTGGKLPIYLSGISMGATTVLMASGLELPQSVVGITADCGFTSPHAIWKHVAESNLHIPYSLHRAAANDMCRQNIQMSADDYSTTEALAKCKVPVMLMHGTDDRFVPVEMTYQNYQACVSPKRLLVVPGATHAISYCVETEKYQREVKEFWAFCENR